MEPRADFRTYLQRELMRRCKANPRYSLRAFARFLEIESSALSKILSGKRAITDQTYQKFRLKLHLSPKEALRYKPHLPNSTQESYQNLAADMFQIIADWYHYAILELTRVRGFKSNSRWIATKLGISAAEVNLAVERLQRLELLRITDEGTWIDESGKTTTVGNPFTTAAFKSLQKQILQKGIVALEQIPLDYRDHSAMTLAINSSKLPEAKSKIKKFRRDMAKLLETQGPLDSVYHLGVCLYPVTQIDPNHLKEPK